MAIQTTGVRYVTQGVDEFISNVQKAQKNLDDMTKNMQASQSAIRGAVTDLNTHTKALNAMIRSNNSLSSAQRIANAAIGNMGQVIGSANVPLSTMSRLGNVTTAAFRGLSVVGRGIGSAFNIIVGTGKGVGSVLGTIGRGFTGLLSSSRQSLMTLTGFGKISETLGSDLGYLARRVLALSTAFAAVSAVESFIKTGFEQVALYDRMTHSVAALTANELLAAGSVSNFQDGLKQAIPFTKQMLDWIEKLAVVSIFESGDIQAVQQFGQSVGMSAKDASAMTFALTAWGTVTDKQPHTLQLIANALTDMFSKGRVQSQEMRQLALNGIPAWDMLAKGMGVTVDKLREMVTDGLVPADEGIRILVESMANTYGPALGDFAFSISGITSSLRDILKINSRELFRGIVEAAMPFMERVVSVLTQPETKAAFQEMGRSLGETATKAFEFTEALIASGEPLSFIALKIDESLPGFFHLYEQLGKLAETFADIAKKAFGWGEGIGKGIAEGLISAASMVLAAMQRIADIINNFLTGKMSPSDAISGAMGDVGDRAREGQEGGGPTPAPQPGGGPGGAPPELPGGTGSQLGISGDIFGPLTDSLDKLSQKADEAKSHWDDLKQGFLDAKAQAEANIPGIEKLTPLVAGLGSAFGVILTSGLASAALGLLKLISPIGLLTAAGAGLYTAWENNLFGIRDRVNEVMPIITQKFGDLKDYLSGPFIKDVQDFAKKFQDSWNEAQGKVEEASAAINKAIKNDVQPVFEEVSEFLEKEVGPVIEEVAKAALPTLGSAFKLIASVIEGIVIPQTRILWEVFSTLLWPIIETGADILSNVLLPALKIVFDFVSDNIIPIYKDFYNFISGSVIPIIERLTTIIVLLVEIGIKDLISKWNETTAAIQVVWDWFNKMIDKVPGLRQSIDGLVGSIGAIIGWINDWIGSFGSLNSVIQDVIGWLDGIIAKLSEVSKTKSAVLGNSPSPLEMSLRGIGATLQDVIKIFDRFTRTIINTGKASSDLAKDLRDIANDTRDFIDDLEESRLSGLIGGLDLSRENLRFAEEFKKDIMEDSDDIGEFWKAHLKGVAEGVGNELEMARQRYLKMAEIDPEAATERFELESQHIKERGDIEAQIAKAKTDSERQRLMKERQFIFDRQKLEVELFEQQAQRRAEAVEKEAKQLVDAFAQAWAQMLKEKVIPTPDLTQLFQLIQLLSTLDLPDWLTPGSPTPLENAVRGISDAMHQLALTELPVLRFQMQQMSMPSSFGQTLASSYSYVYSPNYNLGVTTNQSPQYAFQSFELMRSMYGG